jgi:hypothetical protein
MNIRVFQCEACGLRFPDRDDFQYIASKAISDDTGLNQFHIYCRKCHKVSVIAPAGCLAMLFGSKFEQRGVLDPALVYLNYGEAGLMVFSQQIHAALLVDGVIDKSIYFPHFDSGDLL